MSKPMTGDLAAQQVLLGKPMKEVSASELQGLFLGSAKSANEWYVGLEIELFVLDSKTGRPASYEVLAGLIAELGHCRSMEKVYERDRLVGLSGNGEGLSLEPGGQLEFATRPNRRLKDLRDELQEYVSQLRELTAARGLWALAMGFHPTATVESAPKMPKKRYDIMRSYFGARGARATQMMHVTGSVQCTVDFTDEQNLVNKIRTASRASPFISALVAASPFAQGALSGFQTLRYQVWLETDEARCGVWPEMVDEEGLTAKRYIERALSSQTVLFSREETQFETDHRPFVDFIQTGFRGTEVTVSDFLEHLTFFFPEVRLKNYVELRGADCLPPEEAVAVAGFWRGLLDDEPTRMAADDLLSGMDYTAIRELQPKVAREGLRAVSRIGPVHEVVRSLVHLSYERLASSAPDCADCLLPLVDRAEAARSPADEMISAFDRSFEAALQVARI